MTDQESQNPPAPQADPQVAAALRSAEVANRNVAALAQRVNAFVDAIPASAPPAASPEPAELSWGQLRQAVAAGKLSEEAATDYWQKQTETRTQRLVEERLKKAFEEREIQETRYSEIDQYRAALPGLDEPGSAIRQRAEKSYAYMVQRGMPKGAPETEIAALQAAFGLPHDLRGQRKPPQRMSDIGSGGAAERQSMRPGGDLEPDRRRHYQHLIDIGQYAGWDDPKLKDTLKYVPRRRGA